MGKLDDKNILITGGNKGIGLAIAKLFASEGGNVIITGRNLEDLEKAKQEIKGEVLCFQSDTAKLQDIKALFTEIANKV